jgi:outer membrane protein insertion porin family
VRKATPAPQFGSEMKRRVMSGCLFLLLTTGTHCRGQAVGFVSSGEPAEHFVGTTVDSQGSSGAAAVNDDSDPVPLTKWQGLPVREISFEGVSEERLKPLPDHLPQAVGAPLNRETVADSLRQLYATGLFDTVEANVTRLDDGVKLVFRGTPREFIGTVNVDGAKGATTNAQLQAASRLTAGTRFTQTRLEAATVRMRQTLADNGFNEPVITYKLTRHPGELLVDIAFEVISGVQSRVGDVAVSGDSGMTVDQFRRDARLKAGTKVDHDTNNRALSGVLKRYQKQDRLEADVKLLSQAYSPETKRSNFSFSANRGPVVKLSVEGAKIGGDRLKRLVPVFEEGTVDEDLLNEGDRRLRDYFQRLGYFDVKVGHKEQNPGGGTVDITYTIALGERRRVEKVSVDGNQYFKAKTLEELLSVHAADHLDRHGTYSQALVTSDVNALEGVYQSNGFSKVKVIPETLIGGNVVSAPGQGTVRSSTEPISVVYHIEEGQQQRVGELRLDGVVNSDQSKLLALLNTSPGQLFSPQNLAGDRDALLTDYLSRGFDQVQIEVEEQTEVADPAKIDVVFQIHEGQQIFVRKVLVSGLHYTRPETVGKRITVHPGDPLNQTALAQTQRNLYELALFSEVDTAVQNTAGEESYKTVLLQTTEARRWTVTYGLGFEAQTGTPQNNCRGIETTGAPCSPNGKTGISPRVLGIVTRNNLFGREQSASIQGTYGLLEQNINLLYQSPHFLGNRDIGFTFSGGYASSQNVTTYVSSKLETGVRWNQHFSQPGSFFSKANTFVYEFDFRRVKVAAETLQVGPSEIAALSTAVRVAGPSITWIRDTRDSPLDSHRGTYTSFQNFQSDSIFGAQAEFNRLDLTNASYYGFNKKRFVLARNTRYGQERAYGSPSARLLPLPERLYAGGPISHRGFASNAAGPRDPETGFPIGGAGALVNSTEVRLPPPILPFFGDTLSFVLFHDMGNIFTNAGDAWASALRIHQPDRDACKVLTPPDYSTNPPTPPVPTGPITSTGQQGQCSFNYFSHAAGLGMRYHTPVGPIRLDFSYNLNPPIFPINVNYSQSDIYANQHVGQAAHFNFFFSFGQTF